MDKTEKKSLARYPAQTTVGEELHQRIQNLRGKRVTISEILEVGCTIIEKRKK